jgi:hypothetical protein
MITQQQAEQIVYDRVNKLDPSWPDRPEMIITQVDEHDVGWVIWWTSRQWHETGDLRLALAGNSPYFVSRADGELHSTGPVPRIKERIQEIKTELRAATHS